MSLHVVPSKPEGETATSSNAATAGPKSNLTVDTADNAREILEGLANLTEIGLAAAKFKPPLYIRSVLGPMRDWFFPANYSEFTAADIWRPIKTLRYAAALTIPAIPHQAPAWLPPISKRLSWRPTRMLFNPDQNQNPTTFPDEAWFFINGICTNEDVARMNASYLSKLFHRPIQIVQNATDSIYVDLAECVVGKAWSQMTEPARKAYPVILEALKDPSKKRVVVTCHSQGTIIMANVLRALQDNEFKAALYAESEKLDDETSNNGVTPPDLDDQSLLKKLEIYAFANCATNMTRCEGESYPYIESYGNQYDIVARLGCLAPNRQKLKIEIDGPTFEAKGKWGHLLNQHYLFGMHDYLVKGKSNEYQDGTQKPRLYRYFNGARPAQLS